MARKNQTVTRGSGNIFADLGLPDADEHMLKARVVMFIDKRIAQLGLTQQAAADRIGNLTIRCVQNAARTIRKLFARTAAAIGALARQRCRNQGDDPPSPEALAGKPARQ